MIVLLKMKIKKVEKNSEHKFASDEKKEKSFFFFFVFVVVVVVVVVVVLDRNSAEKKSASKSPRSRSSEKQLKSVSFHPKKSRNQGIGKRVAR